MIRKYEYMRFKNVNHNYFFVSYRNCKCMVQRIGNNRFGDMGKKESTFFKLPKTALYRMVAGRRGIQDTFYIHFDV